MNCAAGPTKVFPRIKQLRAYTVEAGDADQGADCHDVEDEHPTMRTSPPAMFKRRPSACLLMPCRDAGRFPLGVWRVLLLDIGLDSLVVQTPLLA